MAPKSSNNNNVTSTNRIDVDLNFVEDTDITWGDTDKFWEFSNDYDESQEHNSSNTSSDVQFIIITTIKDTGVLDTSYMHFQI